MSKAKNTKPEVDVQRYTVRRSAFQYTIDVFAAAFVINVILQIVAKKFGL